MAIVLKCSKCGEQLEVDDAFAGGICRCIHCGALSHVPHQRTELDKKGRPLTPPQMGKPVVAAPEEQARLVIAPSKKFSAAKKRGLLALVLMIAAVIMLVACVWLGYKLLKTGGLTHKPPGPPEPPDVKEPAGPVKATTAVTPNPLLDKKGPQFLGLDLPGKSVAYLVNAGGGLKDSIDGIRLAIGLSARSLGDAKFVVATWPRTPSRFLDETTVAKPEVFPDGGLASAAAAADRQRLDDWLRKLEAGGPRDPGPAMDVAIQRGAGMIVLITGGDLSEPVAQTVAAKLKGRNIVALAAVITPAAEKYPQLTRLVGGEKNLKVISDEELATWVQEAAKGAGGK